MDSLNQFPSGDSVPPDPVLAESSDVREVAPPSRRRAHLPLPGDSIVVATAPPDLRSARATRTSRGVVVEHLDVAHDTKPGEPLRIIVEGPAILTRTFAIPRVDESELTPLVRHQLATELPGAVEGLVIHTRVLGEDPQRMLRVAVDCIRHDALETLRGPLGISPTRAFSVQDASWGWLQWQHSLGALVAAAGPAATLLVHHGTCDLLIAQEHRLLLRMRLSPAGSGRDAVLAALQVALTRGALAIASETSLTVDTVIIDGSTEEVRETGVRLASALGATLLHAPTQEELLEHHAAAAAAGAPSLGAGPPRGKRNGFLRGLARVVAMAGLLGAAWIGADAYRTQRALTELRETNAAFREQTLELRELRAQLTARTLPDQVTSSAGLDVLQAISETGTSDIRLSSLQLTARGDLKLAGQVKRMASAVAFAESLRTLPQVESVTLERLQTAGTDAMNFQILAQWRVEQP